MKKKNKNSTVANWRIDSLLNNLPIKVNNKESICDYLNKFPDIIDIIPKAVSAARVYFPDAQIVLDLYIDPEIDDKYLVLYVRLKEYEGSIIELLDKARLEILDELKDKKGWIQITTDYKKAK
jgi:hypothetical protein